MTAESSRDARLANLLVVSRSTHRFRLAVCEDAYQGARENRPLVSTATSAVWNKMLAIITVLFFIK